MIDISLCEYCRKMNVLWIWLSRCDDMVCLHRKRRKKATADISDMIGWNLMAHGDEVVKILLFLTSTCECANKPSSPCTILRIWRVGDKPASGYAKKEQFIRFARFFHQYIKSATLLLCYKLDGLVRLYCLVLSQSNEQHKAMIICLGYLFIRGCILASLSDLENKEESKQQGAFWVASLSQQ